MLNDSFADSLSGELAMAQRLRDSLLPINPLLRAYYEPEMARLTASLIGENNEVIRGKIQQLLEVIRLPEKLSEDIANLHRILMQSDETPTQGLDSLTGMFRTQ